MAKLKSDVPFGSEFGPNQVNLSSVLAHLTEHAGNATAFTDAIAAEYRWPRKTADNTRLSLGHYGLRDENDRPTDFAKRLLSLRDNPAVMFAEFARHILLNLKGLAVVEAIDSIMRAGEVPTLISVSSFLKPLGVYVPPSGTHLSKMHGWLQRAGVFREEGKFESLDMARVRELVGASEADIELLSEIPSDQRAVLKALANLPIPRADDHLLDAAEVREYAETVYGEFYDPKNFPRIVLEPLEQAGFITLVKPLKGTGQEAGERPQVSGKSLQLRRTAKFSNEYLVNLVDALAVTGLAVKKLLRKPLTEIIEELDSLDKNIKGKALEALAFYLTRLLGLEFRGWRKRAKETSGFEVDLIVEGARLVFSRWQVQCKNTPDTYISDEDVATEVGVSFLSKCDVILLVTTGKFSRDARRYAHQIGSTTHLKLVLFDRGDLIELSQSPLKIWRMIAAKARTAMQLSAQGARDEPSATDDLPGEFRLFVANRPEQF